MGLLFPRMVLYTGVGKRWHQEVQKTWDGKECTQAWKIKEKGGRKAALIWSRVFLSVMMILTQCSWSTDNRKTLISTVFNQVRYQIPAILSLGRRRQEHPIQGPPRLCMEVEASLGYTVSRNKQNNNNKNQSNKKKPVNSFQIIDKCADEHEVGEGSHEGAVTMKMEERGKLGT